MKSVADGEFNISSNLDYCASMHGKYVNVYDTPKYYRYYYNCSVDSVLDEDFIEQLKNKVDITEIHIQPKDMTKLVECEFGMDEYLEIHKVMRDRDPYTISSNIDCALTEEAKNTPVTWLDSKAEKMIYDSFVSMSVTDTTKFLYGNKNPDSEYMFSLQDLIDTRVVKLTAENTKDMSFDQIVEYKNMLEKNGILKSKIEIEKKDFTKEELIKLKGSILNPDIKYNGEYIFVNEKGELKENIDEEILQILIDNNLTLNLKFGAKLLDREIKPEYFYLFQECRKDYGYEPCEVNNLHYSDMSNYENIVYELLYRQSINNYIDMKDVNEFDMNNETDIRIYREYMEYIYGEDIEVLTPRDLKFLDIGIEFKEKGYIEKKEVSEEEVSM